MTEFKFVQTCSACPEQYEVFAGDQQVGYIRLRHGFFRVDYPDCGGETIYSANTKGDGFFEEEERSFYLAEATRAIRAKLFSVQQEIIFDDQD